jgi:hypothetical protein
MSKLKTYRVIFTDTRYMRIELKARSANAAIKTAEQLYLHGEPQDPRFEDWGGDAFHAPEADEVQS